ncbi:MAG: hypothetical protein AB7C89_05125 [Intestinibacillus sp.]
MYQLVSRESDGVTQYGIEGNGVVVYDITQELSSASFIAYMFNRFEVSPVHVYEVLENVFGYLASPSGVVREIQLSYETTFYVR